MILASRAASRATLAACALALATLALALSGCGGGDSANAGDATVEVTAKPTQTTKLATKRSPVGDRCRKQVGGFLDSMDALRQLLVDGLSYEQYVEEIGGVQAAYDEVPVEKLTLGCLTSAGTPGERAFGKYLAAGNSWGACIDEEGCEAATVEPVLQKQWKRAARLLDEAQAGLAA